MTLDYHLQLQRSEDVYDPNTSVDILGQTDTFIDDQIIKLVPDDAMIYVEEVNTEMLSENYEIEVFKIEIPAHGTGYATGLLTFDTLAISVGDTIAIGDGLQYFVFTYVAGSPASVTEIEYTTGAALVRRTKRAIIASGLNLAVDDDGDTSDEGHLQIELTARRRGRDSDIPIVVTSTNPDAIITQGMFGGHDVADNLYRKYFQKSQPQIENGYMMSPTPDNKGAFAGRSPGHMIRNYTTSSVEYYFDVLTDILVDQQKACASAESFNKESYYVDFDFDCTEKGKQNMFYDIYGSATEPEICQI
jgi:hypothetical protein